MPNRNYQVTIKGLCFDDDERILLVQEPSGIWDLPGGRMEHGEGFHSTLQRECHEELGIECTILDDAPYWGWSAKNDDGLWKVVLCFRIKLPHYNFIPSDECIALDFFSGDTLETMPIALQIHPLRSHIVQPD